MISSRILNYLLEINKKEERGREDWERWHRA